MIRRATAIAMIIGAATWAGATAAKALANAAATVIQAEDLDLD